MTGAALIEAALALAVSAHAGQRDKAGAAYILHPLRVMARVTTAEEKAAALLHDVIEDCGISAGDLRGRGFPGPVVAAVLALTRNDGESYDAFIARAARDPVARAVKLADIEDNLDVLRLPELGDADLARLAKYRKAHKRLSEA